MDAVLLRWPDEAARREFLAGQKAPRLLLVEEGVGPPDIADCLEDWVRLPATEGDVRARLEALTARAGHHRVPVPVIDDDGVLRYGDGWVALPPVETRLAAALTARFGAVVSRESVQRVVWPGSSPGRNVLDVHVLRLRRRLGPLDLVIRTIRSRGFLLEAATRPAGLGEARAPGQDEVRSSMGTKSRAPSPM